MFSCSPVPAGRFHDRLQGALVRGVELQIRAAFCNATFSGALPGRYDNNTAVLTLDPAHEHGQGQFVTSDVGGCFALMANGDVTEFRSAHDVVPDTIDVVHDA